MLYYNIALVMKHNSLHFVWNNSYLFFIYSYHTKIIYKNSYFLVEPKDDRNNKLILLISIIMPIKMCEMQLSIKLSCLVSSTFIK